MDFPFSSFEVLRSSFCLLFFTFMYLLLRFSLLFLLQAVTCFRKTFSKMTDIDNESMPLAQNRVGWTKLEVLVVAAMSSILLAEATEIYLPGVITQAVACQLNLSPLTEGILGVSVVFFLSIGVLPSGYLSKRFGTRKVLLVSQYIAAGSICFCAVLPGYYTLLLSRALIGISAGFIYSIVHLAIGRQVRKVNVPLGNTIVCIAFSVGSAWASFMGFLLLERLGWRVFITCVSLPLFVLPIVLLQFVITEESETDQEILTNDTEPFPIKQCLSNTRLIKRIIMDVTSFFLGYGHILLLPFLIHYANSAAQKAETKKCDNVVQGSELLYLTAAGVANILGRILGLLIQRVMTYRAHLSTLAALQFLSHLAPFLWLDIRVVAISMILSKLWYAMSRLELSQQMSDHDSDYFVEKEHHSEAMSLSLSMGLFGGTIGAINAVAVPSGYVLLAPMVVSVVMFLTAMSITDYQRPLDR